MAEEQLFYRFRTLKHIFEYKELENQEIYFASTDELNDPMEAYKDVIFQGDAIVWKNLFRNYISNVLRVILANKYGYDDTVLIKLVNIKMSKDDDILLYYKEKWEAIIEKWENIIDKNFDKLFFFNNIIKLDELKSYLYIFNPYIYNTIFYYLDMYDEKFNLDNYLIELEDEFKLLIDINNKKTKNEKLIKKYITEQLEGVNVNIHLHDNEKNDKFIDYIVKNDIVDDYVRLLKKYITMRNYIASFGKGYSNPIVWSHYAEDHKGVCLIYKIDDSIVLKQESVDKKFKLYKIEYKNIEDMGQINFFEALVMDKESVRKNWFYYNDIESKLVKEKQYIKEKIKNDLFAKALNKTRHWEYEHEYRLVYNTFDDLSKKDKIFRYDIENLVGIIFGVNTTLEDKVKIIKIIQKKLGDKTKKFEFYQAYYNKNIISKYQIKLLYKKGV